MDSPKPLDLEKELSCSICTEVLYQPLTLLDCLHTFCGSCLKDWFTFQASSAESAQTPPPPGTPIFTCPSCRAAVRGTKHNATVATLLDMFLAANPDKERTDADKEEMLAKYKHGDEGVLPKINLERTPEQLRDEEEDRRLMEEVRAISLRDAGVNAGGSLLAPRQRGGSRSREGSRARRSGESHARPRDGDARSRDRNGDRLAAERRHRRSESGRTSEDSSDLRRRQIEHQGSLRSLIDSDMNDRDVEKEIEEFAREIQEQGLLDGLDLDNIDLSRDDDLSRKITEAYRRRQRGRSRHEPARRSNASAVSNVSRSDISRPDVSRSDVGTPDARNREGRPHSRRRNSTGANSNVSGRVSEDRSRPPLAPSACSRLEVQERTRQRRRTPNASPSGRSRSSTTPVQHPDPEARGPPTTRAQTADLNLQSREGVSSIRSVFGENRTPSSPTVATSHQSPEMSSTLSFASRVPQSNLQQSHTHSHSYSHSRSPSATPPESSTPRFQNRRSHGPADLAVVNAAMSTFNPQSPTTPTHKRSPSHLFPEPSITCNACSKPHIEYTLHYNCKICADGDWNICLDCYRLGKGCQHWFGFGYAAWDKWEATRRRNPNIGPPHMLTPSRFQAPRVTPGGAEGRRTLTTDDPFKRLESGSFCANCLSLANGCYWRCEVCNRGDWGFCNSCVDQGRCCTHPLLPLTYQPPHSQGTPPSSPRSPHRPQAASILGGPHASGIGPFQPLTFCTMCDVCQDPIQPTQQRFHCYACTSSVEPDTLPGDYDVCTTCYSNLVSSRRISAENGPQGWRRCPAGHRMIMVAFQEGKNGQWRYIVRDLVGGRRLITESVDQPPSAAADNLPLMKWTWEDQGTKFSRLVTEDVSATAPSSAPGVAAETLTQAFPPDGGVGMTCLARWGWYGQDGVKADDELYFPSGAEVREVMDLNGDWYYGTYLGAKGLFPSGYVAIV